MATKPLPTDLAGYQNVTTGFIQEDDLMIPHGATSHEDWVWPTASVGAEVRKDGTCYNGSHTFRVYRKIPVANHLDVASEETKAIISAHKAGTLKDSGERREFGTGSVRDAATGKGCPHLLPLRAITLASQQMERGKQKYGARNWELGQPLSSYFDSAMRHLWKHWQGWTDEPHLDAYVWNALCYAETAERIRLGILPATLDDRPKVGAATPEEQNTGNEPRSGQNTNQGPRVE